MSYTKIEIKVPAINRSFIQGNYSYAKPETISANKKMIEMVEKTYGKLIEKWGKVFEVDESIIVCFICTESGGKNAPPNKYKATGLMQVTPKTVYETITKWKSMVGSPLSKQAESFFQNQVSSTSKWSGNRQPSSAELSQIQAKLNDIEYNIAIGIAVIRWMIEGNAKIGKISLDKVMVTYNAGFYGTRNLIKNLSIDEIVLNTSLQKETRDYIVKMLGVHGFLDLYINK